MTELRNYLQREKGMSKLRIMGVYLYPIKQEHCGELINKATFNRNWLGEEIYINIIYLEVCEELWDCFRGLFILRRQV